ncbi:MAG: HDOD domain-containing protein [Acidovorax sp.]|nr:HDOD domain-containing protein [Acidovorax sp.]
METVDDPDSSMAVLSDMVAHDPAIAARVLAVANKAAAGSRRGSVDDVFTATSLVGMQTVREIALLFSVSGFIQNLAGDWGRGAMWRHSVAVGVCAQELSAHVLKEVSINHAFIAGLLHDIGQFWLLLHDEDASVGCWTAARNAGSDICRAEESVFGVSHAALGAWLAHAWHLPSPIVSAIAGHHRPQVTVDGHVLVDVLHMAEVLSNALELGGSTHAHVTYLSDRACYRLGLAWDETLQPLLGRIEARAQYMATFLDH